MYATQEKNNNIIKNNSRNTDKRHWYPVVCKENVTLSQNGLSPEQRECVWNQQINHSFSHQTTLLGFQTSLSIDSEKVKKFLGLMINNAGDPFSTSSLYTANSKVMECAVLDYFAKLWGIQESDSSNEKDRAYWGYVTAMGASEANLIALLNARDYLSGLPLNNCNIDSDSFNNAPNRDVNTSGALPSCSETQGHSMVNKSHVTLTNGHVPSYDYHNENEKQPQNTQLKRNQINLTPVAFCAEESYCGFDKAWRILQIKTFHEIGSGNFPCPLKYPDDYPTNFNPAFLDENGWPHAVPNEPDGSISISCLLKLVTAFVSRGYPPIVVFTIGTTFKGANDNPQAAINELVPILKQHNMYERRVYSSEDQTKSDIRNGFWFHIDGALGGAQLRFLEMAVNEGSVPNMFPNGFPVFDFRIPEVKTISMSPYKWLGSPIHSSVFMIRKIDQVKPRQRPMYIGGLDGTLCGSRSGNSVLAMWDLLSRKSYDDFKEMAMRGEQMVKFSLKMLEELQKELLLDLWLSHSPGSLFVYFKQPREDIVRRYSLGSDPLTIKNQNGTFEQRVYSHICLMPHVSENLIVQFIQELRAPGAFPYQG